MGTTGPAPPVLTPQEPHPKHGGDPPASGRFLVSNLKPQGGCGGHDFAGLPRRVPDDGAVPRLLATSRYLSERLAEAALVCQQAIVGLPAQGLDAGPMAELQRHVLNRTLPWRGLQAA